MMHRTTDIAVVVLLALALGACSAIDVHWWPPPETPADDPHIEAVEDPPRAGDADAGDSHIDIPSSIPDIHARLLRQASIWLELAPEVRQREYAEAERRYANSPDDINLIRLGLYTALTQQARPGEYKPLRDALRERLPHMESRDNSELAAIAAIVLHILDDRERLMAQLTSQNEELQHKLNELKAIEQQLRERDSTDIIRTLP